MAALDYGYGGLSYSNGFGSLNSSKSSKANVFLQGSFGLCVGQIVGGVLMALLSFIYLYQHMFVMGVAVGVVLCFSGAAGIFGAQRKNRDIVNFHVVGALLGVMLTSQFVGLLWREVTVNCALTELFLKSNALEGIVKEIARQEAFSSVHERLTELEDMIDIVQLGVDTTVDYLKENPTGDPARQEREFIKRKLNIIRHHAHNLVEMLRARAENEEGTTALEKKALRERILAAEHILIRIEKHDESELNHPFSPIEYEGIVRSLIAILTHKSDTEVIEIEHTDLKELSDSMEVTKGVINTIAQGVTALDDLQEDTESLTQESRVRRDRYTKEFKSIIEDHRKHSMRDLTVYALQYMPEHCVQEQHGMHYVGIVGLITGCLQLSTIYMGLCVAFRIPVKSD